MSIASPEFGELSGVHSELSLGGLRRKLKFAVRSGRILVHLQTAFRPRTLSPNAEIYV